MNTERKNAGRKSVGGKQPISQHPLFPVIVALWCGALAGLCSVALKPDLIERVISAARIDQFVPMAAPPLGTTFRILFALAMTGLGGLIGALLARQISRPQPAKRERNHPAEAAGTPRARKKSAGKAEASTTAPAPVSPTSVRPGGRRTLANIKLQASATNEAEVELVQPVSTAPETADTQDDTTQLNPTIPTAPEPVLPSVPHSVSQSGILDVRQFDLEGVADTAREPLGSDTALDEAADALAADEVARVDAQLNALRNEPQEVIPAPAPMAERHEAQIFRLPLDAAAYRSRDADSNATPTPAQGLFEAYSQALSDRDGEASAPARSVFAPHDGEDSAMEPATDTGLGLTIGSDEPDNAQTAETGTPFEAPSHLAPADLAPIEADPVDTVAPEPANTVPDDAAKRSAAERIASSQLDELSHLELLERLALAMSQRRADIARETTAAHEAAQAETNETTDETEAPAPFAPPAVQPNDARFHAQDLHETATFPEEEPENAASRAPAGTEAEPEAPAALSRMPAAMRPVDFSDFDDEDGTLPGYIPPRHIGRSETQPRPFAAPQGQQPSSDEAASEEEEEEEEEEETALEQGYSSLLNLSRKGAQRQEFIRIEDDAAAEGMQSVAIFPGEESHKPAPFSRHSTARPEFAENLSVGQHIIPETDTPDQAEESDFSAPHRQNAEESEQALRAALATLQRMSGAA